MSADQVVDITLTPRLAAILDRLCARAEQKQLDLTPREFEGLQQIVQMCEQNPKRNLGEGPVSRAKYDAMMAARDHCKRQTNEAHALIQDLRAARAGAVSRGDSC